MFQDSRNSGFYKIKYSIFWSLNKRVSSHLQSFTIWKKICLSVRTGSKNITFFVLFQLEDRYNSLALLQTAKNCNECFHIFTVSEIYMYHFSEHIFPVSFSAIFFVLPIESVCITDFI